MSVKTNYAHDAWFAYCRFVGGMVAITLLICIAIGIVGGFQYAISDKTPKPQSVQSWSGNTYTGSSDGSGHCTITSGGVFCTNDSDNSNNGTVTSK